MGTLHILMVNILHLLMHLYHWKKQEHHSLLKMFQKVNCPVYLIGPVHWVVKYFLEKKNVFGNNGNFFFATDVYYRSSFSSSASPSKYLNVDGYALLNARAGFRASLGLTFFIWSRNLLNKDYFEQLLPAAGNAGHYAGVLGDPRTFGVTLRYAFQKL